MDLIAWGRFALLLSVLIFVHEFGHFLVARLFGVKVEEFGFGLPPRVWSRKIKGTLYSLNLLPIGGFVRLKGEEGEALGFGDSDSFAVQSKLKRLGIVVAGALGNFVLAWFLFSLLLNYGMAVSAGKVLVGEVDEGSPAAVAGILSGDFITSLEGEPTETAEELFRLTRENLEKNVVLEVERGGERTKVNVLPRSSPPSGEGPLGVGITTAYTTKTVPFWQTPFLGFQEAWQTLTTMAEGIWETVLDLFRGEEVMVGGPVAIYAYSKAYGGAGLQAFLNFMALVSINLVVVNLLPIPALDGGRVLLVGIEALRRKRISPRVEAMINSVGLALLLALMVLLSIRDLRTFF